MRENGDPEKTGYVLMLSLHIDTISQLNVQAEKLMAIKKM
jgi:hypothetical protein